MNNNEILSSLRYTFDLGDTQMMEIFGFGDKIVSRTEISNWLKKEEDEAFISLTDKDLAVFLNGFIVSKRGKKEGAQPAAEKKITNNLVLLKLKIALDLKGEQMVDILALRQFRVSKHEMSAFFRKPDQSQYRECKDQILRNFVLGLQLKFRPNSSVGV